MLDDGGGTRCHGPTLVYETGGSELLIPVVWVAMVNSVVTPSDTRAGTALASSQNDTQDTMTSMQHGM